MNIQQWFEQYVDGFSSSDPVVSDNILLKRNHSKRVSKEIVDLAHSLGVKADTIPWVRVMGLLHDIGRFEQFITYHTFDDRKSEDHGVLGVTVLEKHAVLKEFESEKEVILKAIQYHNKASLPSEMTTEQRFYSKLLRDADKLDIFKVFTDLYGKNNGKAHSSVELELPNTEGISEALYRSLLNREIGNFKDVHNINDFKLLKVGWIFDINFLPTLQRVKERGYLDIVRGTLPRIPEVERIFSTVHEYIEESGISRSAFSLP
jgi:putative nucleotidyltransferase with HDIG domain